MANYRKKIPAGQLEGGGFSTIAANSLGVTHPEFTTQEDFEAWVIDYIASTNDGKIYHLYPDTQLTATSHLSVH